MKTKAYEPTDFRSKKDLIDFLRSLYGTNDNFNFFLKEYERAYNFCCVSTHITFFPVAFYEGEQMVAHVALIVDDRLPEQHAFFGFFEIVDDVTVFGCVWQKLTYVANMHKLQIIKGPVNGSIWHQYRCIKESSSMPFFRTEPMTPLYYHDFFSQVKPINEVTYSSGVRESYSDILGLLRKHKEGIKQKLDNGNFRIEVNQEISADVLLSISQISAEVFDEKSWGYTKLETDEFLKLYDPNKINEHIHKLFLLYQGEVLVGYCSTMKEGQSLICKTICILPELQGTGLGNALALKIHEEAERDKIEKIMYVLIKDGNQVHNYPTKDVKVFRRYSVFEYELPT